MSNVGSDVRRVLTKATEAWTFFEASIQAFHANLVRYDYEGAERERERAKAALDDYFDNFGAARKRLESERPL